MHFNKNIINHELYQFLSKLKVVQRKVKWIGLNGERQLLCQDLLIYIGYVKFCK